MIGKRKLKKEKWKMRLASVVLLAAICTMALPTASFAKTDAEGATARTSYTESAAYERAAEERSLKKISYNLPGIPSRYISSYAKRSIVYNGSTLSKSAAVINGIIYVPMRLFSETIAGGRVTYDASARHYTVSASGLYISAQDGGYVIYANDRPIFSFSPSIIMSDGEMYVPSSALEKIMGIKRTSETKSAVSYSGYYSPLASATRFYREDEVYWLSKIISAESAGESLLGQIAVGDVILNRVKSNQFPNTIYSVIFDKKYGVQFSPTADGRIYASPTYTAILAAKICLEGVSLSDDAMYFLNPRAAESNWIVKNRQYVYTIGNHDFYK